MAAASLLLGCLGHPGLATAAPHAKATASVSVIQAVPAAVVDIAIDGSTVAEGADVGAVLGPFDVAAGQHTVTFKGADLAVTTTLDATAGSSTDLVLHLPAEVDGEPVVHSYALPSGPIGPGKARVVLAHTATVPPADVRVNGETVFTNIANGEFAEADLPAGTHAVALLPTGQQANPILGPVDVSLDSRTLSMIYAYGNPSDGSMNVIAHTIGLAPDGTVEPTTIDTGSGGWAADLGVRPFSAVHPEPTG